MADQACLTRRRGAHALAASLATGPLTVVSANERSSGHGGSSCGNRGLVQGACEARAGAAAKEDVGSIVFGRIARQHALKLIDLRCDQMHLHETGWWHPPCLPPNSQSSLGRSSMLATPAPTASWTDDGCVHVTIPRTMLLSAKPFQGRFSRSDDEIIVRTISGESLDLGEFKRVVADLDAAYGWLHSGAEVLRLFCQYSSPQAEPMVPGSELANGSGGIQPADLNRLLTFMHKDAQHGLPQHHSAPMLRPPPRMRSDSAGGSLGDILAQEALTAIASGACEAFDITPYEPLEASRGAKPPCVRRSPAEHTSSDGALAGPDATALPDQAPTPPSPQRKKSKATSGKPTGKSTSTLSPPGTAGKSRTRRHSASAALPSGLGLEAPPLPYSPPPPPRRR